MKPVSHYKMGWPCAWKNKISFLSRISQRLRNPLNGCRCTGDQRLRLLHCAFFLYLLLPSCIADCLMLNSVVREKRCVCFALRFSGQSLSRLTAFLYSEKYSCFWLSFSCSNSLLITCSLSFLQLLSPCGQLHHTVMFKKPHSFTYAAILYPALTLHLSIGRISFWLIFSHSPFF